MSGLSDERRREIEATAARLEREYEWIAAKSIRDLLAESAALRTERDAHAWTARTYRAKYDRLTETLDDPDKRHWKAEWEQQWNRAEAAEARLAAPASPDDLARVTDAGDALYDSLANDKCWCGPTVKCRRCKKLSEWETARVLLARLTPPTGPQER